MGKRLDTLRKLISNPDDVIIKQSDEEKIVYKGYSAKANERVTKYFETKHRNTKELDENWNIYSQSEVPFAAITALSYNVTSDYRIVCEDEEVKKELEKFFRRVKWKEISRDIIRDCCVFGDAFLELAYNNGKKLSRAILRDPRTFKTKVDKKGEVIEYLQFVTLENEEATATLLPEEMANFQLFTDPGSPYGLSLISPSKDTIKRKTKCDEGITAAMDRHGFPKYHIILKTPAGYETEYPSKSEINSAYNDFKNISSKNEVVTTELIEIKPLDSKGIEHIEEYFNYFQSAVTCALLVPQEILGLGSGSTEATAKVRRFMFQKLIEGFQNSLTSTTQEKIINRIITDMGKDPEEVHASLIYADAVPEDDIMVIDGIAKMMPKGDPFAVLTRDEIREKLGYPPLELAQKERSKAYSKILGIESKEIEGDTIEKAHNVSDIERLLNTYSSKLKQSLRDRIE